jgi:hypothetical protein
MSQWSFAPPWTLEQQVHYLEERVVSRGRLRRLEERIRALEHNLARMRMEITRAQLSAGRAQEQLRRAQVWNQALAQANELAEPAEAHADEGTAVVSDSELEIIEEQEGADAQGDYEPFYLESTADGRFRYVPYG